ncbi:hypothetical protein CUMW_251960 [Citrus unshiu]|uniref:Uncharacterized protein n=1 Tax=Citrus unshiu TaxID=55188 RepID=A0A2H5QQH9_CITUN|nr:hypothetical protein CUMW_251960 [Citrus unshiu]
MEGEDSTFGSIEELKEPLIGKEENLEPLGRSSEDSSSGWVSQVIRAPTRKDFEAEKNNSISIDLVGERKELIIHVDENLEPQAECCIYRVPRALRKMNKEAYTPTVISIGPLHHGNDKFADMEKQKIRYIIEFDKRIRPEKWQQLVNFIEENEKRIRNSYEENSELKKPEFITMILYDAVFIIELFLRYWPTERSDDFLLDRTCLSDAVWLDLQLLENQLPFFVLDGLYKSAFPNLDPDNGHPSFILLSCVFFGHCKVGEEINVKAEDILHFTHLSRYFKTKKYPKEFPKQGEELRDLACAVKLQGSGVQFKGISEGACLLDINFEERKWLGIPCLKVAELQIPHIEVDDYTETLMRNLMALEQCHYPRETIVCNYVDFMDMLIDTDEDVNKLAEARIISNFLGESARIAKMFNDLCLEISLSDSNYAGNIRGLKRHYENSWNNAKATLKRVYFSNLWKGTGTVAALLLLVFNLIQAIWSIISAFS